MKQIFLIVLILLVVSLLFTALGIWSVVLNHVIFGTVLMVVYSVGLYLALRYLFNFNFLAAIITFLCSGFFIGTGFIAAILIKDMYEQKAGVLYVLADISDMREYIKSHQKSSDEKVFEAVLKAPTFGLMDQDTVCYDYFHSDTNLDATFPILGKKVLMKYPVALPKSIGYQELNPDDEQLRKYATPVIVAPDGQELVGDEAMEYIREYIKQNQ